MVEVFKTNVEDRDEAARIIARIHKEFTDYTANFDLEDCDNILRVKSPDAPLQSQCIINLVCEMGFRAEILHDMIIPAKSMEYIY
ncbi:MAG: hypothetical protein ACRDE8_09060 [Ginsengibacter sp.]